MRFSLLFLFVFLRFTAFATDALYMPVQFIVENGNYDNSLVVLKKNGETVFTLPGEKNMRLKLECDNNYVVAFSKPGYITKQIQVDTRAPEERRRQGFDPYKIGVRLYKQYSGINIVVYNQPVASIRYMASLDDFGYDTDYTKSILSLLTETENKLAARAEEERQLDKGNTKVFTAKEASNRSNKSQQESTDNIPIVAATKNASETKPVATEITASPSAPSPSKIESVEKPLLPRKMGTGNGQSATDAILGDGGEDIKDKISNGKGDDQRSAAPGIGKGIDPEKKELSATDVSVKTSEELFEPHRTITTIRILKDGKTSVYHRVNYLNGDCFYFMNGITAISRHLFEYFTGETK